MSEWANANCDVVRVCEGCYGLPDLTVNSREGWTNGTSNRVLNGGLWLSWCTQKERDFGHNIKQ